MYFNANDDSQIIVRGFYYPQPGPDAFFWAGEDEPSCSEQSITGRNYLLAPGKVGSKLVEFKSRVPIKYYQVGIIITRTSQYYHPTVVQRGT